MKRILFILLLLAFTIEAVFPFRLTHILGLSLKNMISYLAIIVLLVSEIALRKGKKRKIPALKTLILIVIGVGMNIIYIRLTRDVSLPPVQHLILFKKWIIDPIILYILVFFLLDNQEDARNALIFVVLTFAILNVASLITLKLGFKVFTASEFVGKNMERRFAGAFKNPNQMAYLLSFLIPFIYYFFKTSSNKVLKVVLVIAMLCSIVSILMSASRGGILSLCIVLMVVTMLGRDYKLLLISLSFIAVLTSIYYLTGKNSFLKETSKRVEVLAEGNLEKASNFRFYIWNNYKKIIMENKKSLFLGRGFGLSTEIAYKKTHFKAPPHNLYLQILVEFGIIGILIWLLLIGNVVRFIIHCRRDKQTYMADTIIAACCVILFGWFFTSMIYVLKFISVTFATALCYLSYLNCSHA